MLDSDRPNKAELLERRHSIIQTDLLRDLAILDSQYGRSREPHFPAGRSWKRSSQEVLEGWSRVCATAFPAADHIVALSDEIGGTQNFRLGNASRKPDMNALISSRPRRGACNE